MAVVGDAVFWDTRKCPWLRLSEEHHDSVHVKRQVCYPSELWTEAFEFWVEW
jgi:hypothetical protein